MKLRTSHRTVTGAAALSLAFATPLALPGVVVPTAMAQTASTIKGDTATLTIHKYAGTTGERGTGEALNLAPAKEPLDGATFTIQRLNLDIKSNAAWKEVNKHQGDAAAFAEDKLVGEPTKKTTANGGIIKFQGAVGFYLVQETAAPAGYTPNTKPFIVALPMTNNEGSEWNYHVHVYPKNEKFVTEKTVKDDGQNVGDTITYNIDAKIPAVDGESIKAMTFTDLMDPRLTVAEDDIKIEIVDAGDMNADITSNFTPTVTSGKGANEDQYYVYADGNERALKELAAAKKAHPEAKVRMVVPATVNNLGEKDGEITNTAYVYAGAGQGDTKPDSGTPPTPGDDDPGKTPEVKTYMGKVQITKKNKDGDASSQKGAQFQVYKCTSNERVKTFGGSNGSAGTTIGEGLSLSGQDEPDTFTADKDGLVTINGLHVQDFVDGEAVDTSEAPLTGDSAQGYCLVETKAPEGYEMLPEPIFFQVAKDAAKATTPLSFDIQDPDKNAGFELPLTGARGVILFALLGGGLLLLAGFVSRRNKKATQ